MARHLIVLVIVLLLTTSAVARDYVVAPDGDDANPGTLEKPMKDPVRAARKLMPGDRLVFRAGVYKCRANRSYGLAPYRDGEPGKPITFINHDGEHVQIDCTGSDWGVTPNGYSYIVFDGLDITNRTHYGMKISAASGRRGEGGRHIYSHHVTIRNCEVHHTGGECIFSYGTEHLLIENCHLHHSGRSHGLYLQVGCHHAVVRNNTSEHNRGNSGMQLNAAGGGIRNATVERNLLRGNAQGFSLMGVQDSVFRRNVLYNNCFAGPRGSGYREIICWTYGKGKKGQRDNSGTPCKNVLFDHNTVVNLRPGRISHLLDIKSNSKNIVFRDNILQIAAQKPLMTVAADSTAGLRIVGNLYQTPVSYQVRHGGDRLKLDAFLSAIKSAGENRTGDPKLKDPEKGDFTPAKDGPAVRAGGYAGAIDPSAKGPIRIGCNRQPWKNKMALPPPTTQPQVTEDTPMTNYERTDDGD
jgi:hypothetical protein